jgi:transcriptional regulator with XRE-family HTH domain
MQENVDWYAPEFATFGDRVVAAREAAAQSQKELARRMGIRQATLRNWEEDISEPRANKLSLMAGILNVSIMWLINGEGEGMQSPPAEDMGQDDIRDILLEMRKVQSELKKQGDHIGRLEKRLRKMQDTMKDA